MRHTVFAAVCLLILAQPVPAAAVGKITVDPNTVTINVTRTAGVDFESDTRLNQKVTYQVKQGRLHDVARELSGITGVSIFCGKTGSDWRVRDIPVTISAKDIELGKLLSAIANTTHVALIPSNIDDGPCKYRFMRTPRMEKALAEYEIVQNIRKRLQFDKEWAAAASLASQPEQPGDDVDSMKFNNARAIGVFVSALGTNVRDSMKTGEQVVLQGENISDTVRSAMLELAATMRKRHESGYSFCGSYYPGSKATQEEMEQAEVILSTSESSNNIWPNICVNCPAHNERGDACMDSLNVSIKDTLDYVKLPEASNPPPDPLGGSDIATKYTKVKWNDPGQEFLKMKVKLKSPDRLEGVPTLGDVTLALSDASGYTIVCEDFESHKISSRINSFPQGEMTFQDVLRIFRWDVDWFVDPENNLIAAVSRAWVDAHKGLVPESLIQQMKAKLEKDGVNLDDATPLTTLTDEQYNGWISGSRDLASLTLADFGAMKPLWALYDSLDKDEKQMTRSEDGISLSVFEPILLAAACKKCNAGLTKSNHDRASRKQYLLPTDPKVLSSLKMRVTSKENWVGYQLEPCGGGYSSSRRVSPYSPNDTKPPLEGMLRKTTYIMQIFGNSNGESYLVSNDGPNGFPYFALKWKDGEHGPQGTPAK